jgi:DNA-directed RNA polymerase subunit beta
MLYDNGTEVCYAYKAKEVHPDSIIIRSPVVKIGQRVKAGDVLIKSNHTKDGFLANGKNALTVYCPNGFNYEDGVFSAERLQNKLTSYGHNIERTPVSKGSSASVHTLASKFVYLKRGQRLYNVMAYRNGRSSVNHQVFSKGLSGFLVDVNTETDSFTKSEKSIVACTVSFDRLMRGDKLANRHGNKGVVPKNEKNSQMLILNNGDFVDICYNPAGVTSRMNIGQVLEANTGLAAFVLGIHVMSDAFNGISREEVKMLLSYAYDMANNEDPKNVISQYPNIPKDMHDYCMTRIDVIQSWKGVFDRKGRAEVINPKTGKPLDKKVTLGVTYVYKLVQEVARKVHARGGYATEDYVKKFDAPTKGSNQGGGQQMGYMEMAAFSAYGASALIHELMNERGDNGIMRSNLTAEALLDSEAYHLDESNAIRRATEGFVEYFMGLGIITEFENGELPNATIAETTNRDYYDAKTLLLASNTKSEKKDKTKGSHVVASSGSFVKGIIGDITSKK